MRLSTIPLDGIWSVFILSAFIGCSTQKLPISKKSTPYLKQKESAVLADFFKEREGCFLLRDLSTGVDIDVHKTKKCSERISPNSTFKIPLALMAFDSGVIEDENTLFEWDGTLREITSWNQNHTAKTWLRDSVVWYSQKLAQELGFEKIRKYLADFKYGNQDFSGGLTKAWLSSTLKISAEEQIDFLTHLYERNLNISQQAIDKTLKILPREALLNDFVFAKTGSGFSASTSIGWYVGYLLRGNHWYAFTVVFEAPLKSGPRTFGGLEAKKMVLKYFDEI